jgi:vanillate O-demethylase monooxygenase subunit
MPAGSGFSASDWAILSGFWHPVAYASEVAERPFAATLLGVRLVAYRSGGRAVVAPDRCPHRGAALSLGRVGDGCLVCPYHGASFGGGGESLGMPGSERPAGVPDLGTVRSAERFGLVWACLNPEPRCPLPDWGLVEEPGIRTAHLSDFWDAAASRHVENFTDVAHFAFVHSGTFGNTEDPVIPQYEVQDRPNGLRRTLRLSEVDFDDATGKTAGVVKTVYEYDLSFPFATRLTILYAGRSLRRHFMDVPSPVGPRRSRIFIISASEDPAFDPEAYNVFQTLVNAEDKGVVQSQRPEELPLDLREEAHLGADRFSVEYRRRLAAMGLGSAMAS